MSRDLNPDAPGEPEAATHVAVSADDGESPCHASCTNLLNRQLTVAAPNRVWGSDISALLTQEGWLSIAIVVDLFSRKVVGLACAASMATCLVTSALQMAIGQRQPKLVASFGSRHSVCV